LDSPWAIAIQQDTDGNLSCRESQEIDRREEPEICGAERQIRPQMIGNQRADRPEQVGKIIPADERQKDAGE